MISVSLEGMRGVAALFVVLFHMQISLPGLEIARNGYLAVDLFFVLSGFVIAAAYGERVGNLTDLTSFMVRRLGRLWPTHLIANVLFYIVPGTFGMIALALGAENVRLSFPTTGEALGLVFMLQGLPIYDHFVGTLVSWSTSVEFYVYLLFGVVCLLVRGRARTSAYVVLAAAGYATAVWAAARSHDCAARLYCFSLAYDYGWARGVAGFFLGALIADHRNAAPIVAITRPAAQIVVFAVATLLMMFANVAYGSAYLAPAIFALVIASMSRDTGPVARIFRARPAQYLGKLSYSLYLGHAVLLPFLIAISSTWRSPVGYLTTGALYLAASIALAARLNRTIEIPFREKVYAWADAEFQSRPAGRPASDR
ncbi:acyltransferase family protein [Burkholderia cenocepacia]|uniref:acyltransferase family protein n=1 Tax=Burkholderia cenocepacia TaxID=95486 RepID=UPI00117801FC|nr:acyltransferase [Burkholderia cenocepacia]